MHTCPFHEVSDSEISMDTMRSIIIEQGIGQHRGQHEDSIGIMDGITVNIKDSIG